MTGDEWNKIQHFEPAEFDSPDKPGTGWMASYELVRRLDDLRSMVNEPIRILSGVRTYSHNAGVGGVDGSAHVSGLAADIACRTSAQRMKFLAAALSLGFTRIGIGDSFLHLDIDPTKPAGVLWLY